MYSFTALIYDGNRQQIVTHTCDNEAAFNTFLTATYGVYVCLWVQQLAVESFK